MRQKIGITAWGSVSPLGAGSDAVAAAYAVERSFLSRDPATGDWRGVLRGAGQPSGKLAQRGRLLQQIDRSVQLAFLAADEIRQQIVWRDRERAGINIGSSRGATGLWEQYYTEFTTGGHSSISPLSSPTTTLGNISSWLGAYLEVDGPFISHSVTCSSALQALINGVAWLESGRCRQFIAGGAEAPLTDFTLAQMKALRIYAEPEPAEFPCRSLDRSSTSNTMVLGEAAALFVLETEPSVAPAAWLEGIGFAQEIPASPTAVSSDARALQHAMRQALKEAGRQTVDVVICHAPGTRKGDAAERRAVEAVFDKQMPFLTGNKWKIGHTLGASAALSLEMALLMLQQQRVFRIPFLQPEGDPPEKVESVLINAMGFGGNAASIVVGRAM